jgi:hypothetical protein
MLKLRFGIVFALLAVLVGANVGGSDRAEAQFVTLPGFPPGVFQSRAAIDAPASASCSPVACPGDVVSGAIWSAMVARCYSVGYTGNHLDIADASTGNTTGTRLQCSGGAIFALVSA